MVCFETVLIIIKNEYEKKPLTDNLRFVFFYWTDKVLHHRRITMKPDNKYNISFYSMRGSRVLSSAKEKSVKCWAVAPKNTVLDSVMVLWGVMQYRVLTQCGPEKHWPSGWRDLWSPTAGRWCHGTRWPPASGWGGCSNGSAPDHDLHTHTGRNRVKYT